ncbi:hypothetical protein EYB25_002236 [Talaromyces marneffei]|nr:hypothetical protein EYB25_002236 [Talaromyces marneffei]
MIGRRLPLLAVVSGLPLLRCRTISHLFESNLSSTNNLSTYAPNTVHAMSEALDDKMLATKLPIKYCFNFLTLTYIDYPI